MSKKFILIPVTLLSLGVITLGVLFFLKVVTSKDAFPIMFTLLGIEQLLLGVSNYKAARKSSIFNFITGAFILIVVIIMLLLG